MATKPFIVKSNVGIGTSTVSTGVRLVVMSGNVGIGTATVNHRLEVWGGNVDIAQTGFGLVFPDNSFQTTAYPGADGLVTTFSAGTTGLTPSTATSGAITLAGTLNAANGGTGQSSYAVGDILYASGATTLSKLVSVATGNVIISGGVTTAPSWGKVGLTTHVTGTLPVANGGTGAATFTTNGILYGNGTSAIQVTSQGGANTILTANAGAPSFSATPTIGTSVTVPLVIGGTSASSTLTLQSTSGSGTTDNILFKVGSNGATTAMTINTNGRVGIGTNGLTDTTLKVWGSLPTLFNTINVDDPQIIVGNSTSTGTTLGQNSSLAFSYLRALNTGTNIIAWTNTGVGINNITSPKNALDVAGAVVIGGGISYAGSATAPSNGLLVQGSVGIGTATPSSTFHVQGNSLTTGTNTSGSFIPTSSTVPTNGLYLPATNRISLATNTTERMTVDSSGNVGIGTNAPTYALHVNGTFAAITKSFLIEHPTKPGKKLRYGSLEGPENGVYIRGRTQSHIIELPDYWLKLVDLDSITVNLTPVGSSKSIAVKKIEENKVYLTSGRSKTIDCYFMILAERKDVEKLQVEI